MTWTASRMSKHPASEPDSADASRREDVRLCIPTWSQPHHRPDLEAFARIHLDAGLRARVDPSDLVQEVQLEAVQRIQDFLGKRVRTSCS
jgi:hypothetical protein